MGSPANEPGHRLDEEQVLVTLSRGFWMGQYEVTQEQWTRFAGAFPQPMDKGVGLQFPVHWVSYIEAERFCRRLTEAAHAARELDPNWEFRLPTEAQWEYACRAGTTTAWSFGHRLSPSQANFKESGLGTATKAGAYPPNAWGIHDMHGNVFEWVRDWYHVRLPGGTDPDLTATKGSPNRDGSYSRVRRGGAWNDPGEFLRSALRLRYEPERRSDHIGFRVVAVETAAQDAPR
jgi:formylglycine-generating enzyme required for sulfatase activity